MNWKSRFIPYLVVISAIIGFSSCKSKKTYSPCGDPPPPSSVPAVRITDKLSDTDYFFKNPGMYNKLTAYLPCNTGKQIDITYQPIMNFGKSYAYGLRFYSNTGLYIAAKDVSADCYKMILKWNNTDEDTVQFYYHPVVSTCFTTYELDSVYFNGVKAATVVDENSWPAKTYYNLLK